ncbi:MAG: patatin-like phospholipase family protein, partial [Chromatiaceae bacterium]
MTEASGDKVSTGPFDGNEVLKREHMTVAARRSGSREAFLRPSPPCYVKSVDHALKARDQELKAYFDAVDAQGALAVPNGLAGLALSGGGVRSATFNLGVLQRLHELGILQKLDYLSTVSGGGYIGCSLTAYVAAAQKDAFPYSGHDETEQREGLVLRHLRRFSSYLVARGWLDALAAAFTALGGTLANLLILLPYLLALAVLAVIQLRLLGWPASIAVAVVLVGGALLTAFSYAIAQARPEATAQTWGDRETFGRRMAVIGGIVLVGAVWIIQPVLLSLIAEGLGKADWHKAAAAITGGGLIAGVLSVSRVVLTSPILRRPVLAALLVLVMLALLWVLFATLGITLLRIQRDIGTAKTAGLGLAASAVLVALGRFLPTNCGSLHGFYRDRLSKAYFFKPPTPNARSLQQYDDCQLSGVDVEHTPYLLVNACLNISDTPSRSEDLTKEYMRPGRRGGFFLFSREAVGNDALGYVPALKFQEDNGLRGSLATAMAISGAAFGANMGYKTNPAAVLLLTLLNVRTACWVKFPAGGASSPPLQRLLGDYAY